jgi:hypothetical protein
LLFIAAGLANEVHMSAKSKSSSGCGGALAFTGVVAVIGVIGYLLVCQAGSDLLQGLVVSNPPLALTVRDTTAGKGKVLRITNTSNRPIHQVRLSVSNRQDHYERVIADTIRPHDTIEFRWTESGVALEKGMLIELRASGYEGSFRDTIL